MLLSTTRADNKKAIIDLIGNVFLSALCAGQAVYAFTLSVSPAKAITYGGIKPVPELHFWGAVLLALMILAVTLIVTRPVLTAFFCLLFFNSIALINYYELLFRGTVFTHQDLRNITTALSQLPGCTFQITPPVQGIILSFLFAVFLLTLLYAKDIPFMRSKVLGGAAVAVFGIFSYAVVFSPASRIKGNDWNWELQYYSDSFVIGTIENLKKTISPFQKPEGYTESGIRNATGLPGSISSYPDIIFILNETYYNAEHLLDFEPDVQYMKNYDKLNAIKGYASVPKIGGATNASEYELLTGNSVSLLNTMTPFNDLNFSESRSIVEYLESLGYTSMAAHSERGGNYHRITVFKELGFDNIHFKPDFSGLETYKKRGYWSDSSVFRNFTRFYEDMPVDKPRFAYLLTIQNHTGWNKNNSSADLVHVGNSRGLSEFDREQMNEFLTCIKQTDDTIEEIIGYFSQSDRDVVVYMVGDHCPSILNGLTPGMPGSPDSEEQFNLKKRQVPYLIWNNFGEGDGSGVLPENKNIDLCALTPYALKVSGLPLSPYYHQLLKASESVQCLTGISVEEQGRNVTGYFKADGTLESINSGTESADIVKDYFFMEYNNLKTSLRIDSLFDPQ